jgi:hypothetical protein
MSPQKLLNVTKYLSLKRDEAKNLPSHLKIKAGQRRQYYGEMDQSSNESFSPDSNHKRVAKKPTTADDYSF